MSNYLRFVLLLCSFCFFIQVQAQDDNAITYEEIAPGLWLHVSSSRGIGSNGLIFSTVDGVVLVDTPWDDQQTQDLLDWVETTLQRSVSLAIITHSHDDRAGGAQALEAAGIPMIANVTTSDIVKRELGVLIKPIVSREDPLYRHNDCEIFFPGGGHTRDNVVVWFPKQSVLFGGCFLKSATSRGMGYVKEADIAEWPKAVNRVVERYGHAKIFVPGHGSRGNFHIITNTMELLRQYIKTEFNRDCLSCAITEEH